ncbi:MAG TPA: DUF3987 domain-containing protein [Rubricoccaceae bacterium]
MTDLFPDDGRTADRAPAWDPKRDGYDVAARYVYTDAEGTLVFEKERRVPKAGHPAAGRAKTFVVRRPDPDRPGRWLYKQGPERPLYRAEDVRAAREAGRMVFVTEGEKDADNVAALGLTATTNDGGAGTGKWHPEHAEPLRGVRAIVLHDHDATGRAHARNVCRSLVGVAAEVRLLTLDTLPDGRPMPVKGDVSDWLDAGGTADMLKEAVRTAPVWSETLLPEDAPVEAEAPKPVAAPPFVPFPTSALPPALAMYGAAHAAALNVDEAAICVPMLPAVAAAVGNSYEAEPRPGWRERSTVWATLIQPSGTLKSQCVYLAVAPVLALEKEAAEAFADAQDEYDLKMGEWNTLPKAQKTEDAKPAKPRRRRYRVGDTTVESVAAVHSENTRSLLGYRDELSGWLGSMNQYNRGDSDAANWMEMNGGRPVVIDRKSDERGVLYIEQPNVSMVGTIQPATLAGKMGPGHFTSGFAARLLFAEPPTRPRRWKEGTATVEVDAAYHATIHRLYDLEEGSGVLPFSPEAVAIFRAFYDANGATLDHLPDGPLRASISKIEGYTVRLALSFHLCDCVARGVTPGPVTADAVERAVVVASWLRYEQARVYRLHGFDRLALDADARKALELPEAFGWQEVADAWSVGKSGAYVVLARLVEKQIAESAAHGSFRRLDSGRLDFVDYGITFDPLVHKVHRSTVQSGALASPLEGSTGDGAKTAPPVLAPPSGIPDGGYPPEDPCPF